MSVSLPTYLPTHLPTSHIPTYLHSSLPAYLPTFLTSYLPTYIIQIGKWMPTYGLTSTHTFICSPMALQSEKRPRLEEEQSRSHDLQAEAKAKGWLSCNDANWQPNLALIGHKRLLPRCMLASRRHNTYHSSSLRGFYTKTPRSARPD